MAHRTGNALEPQNRSTSIVTIGSVGRWPLRGVVLGVVVAVSTASACGGERHEVKTSAEEPATWRHRGVWTEKQGDHVFVMVVGSATSASLDRGSAMESAEQAARERMAIYLGSTVQAFRERLARRREVAARRSDDDETRKAAELTSQLDTGGRTIAERSVRGLEFANSFVENSTDTLFVLGRLDLDAFRKTLLSDRALSAAEREMVSKNADVVRAEMDSALEEAREAKP
ncbi:MAG TPA: hypothetical protein VJT73_02800 [Polyangiaceae bacterium]|nr:hypothetical protein [Polyangiaceae bacterium]